LLTRGQMIKVASQLFRQARANNYLVPTNRGGGGGEDGVAFEGATVLDPTTGFYTEPIATLDFASLYPSIIIAHNLCYSTIITQAQANQLDDSNVTKTPCGNFFVKSSLRPGLLPLVLQDLLSARKRARKELAEATDPLTKMVLNGRQLALKISANSVYGFTGATVGMLPCLEISSSTTAFGRQMIDATKSLVEQKFTRLNGFEHDAVVVYGDTDSVFVKFGCDNVAESMRLGKLAADEISKTFLSPIKLEFEKIYYPDLLMNKKRYAGLYWTKADTFDKLDAKGIETVRRDNCELVKLLIEKILDIILKEMSIDKAVKFVQNTIADLLQNKVDLSMLVISKSLAKGVDSEAYSARQAHVELAEKMRQRDPANAPSVGDRIQYVFVKSSKGMKAYDKAEDPLYVLENNLSIDGYHYIEHQLKQPLMRIFENILPNAESLLFAGDHTRKVSNLAPSTGGLAGFVTKSLKCLSCKVVIKLGALCDHCKKNGKEAAVVLEKVRELREHEIAFNRLWSQCQRCQGSLCQDVICTSRDCPIFYRRTKVRKDAALALENVKRLQEASDW
jgi:DNA polymerase delta subunit 1